MSEEDFQEKKEELANLNPDMIFYDGLEPALIGAVQIFNKVVALYDYEKCIDHLIERDGGDYEMVTEHLEYNTLGSYVGENTPGFLMRTESFYDKAGSPSVVRASLHSLTSEERKEAFSDFCIHCGDVKPEKAFCTCMMDD